MIRLITKDIKKSFETKEVLKGAGFTFEQGKIYGLLGRNGAGKTTLFNCISGNIDTDGGEILLEENGQFRPLSVNETGLVTSTPYVPEFLTGNEFLKFFLEIQSGKITNLKTPDEYFNMIQFGREDRTRLIKDYSHGMKSKMQLLINIIANPPVLLLDEPLTSLDVVAADEMKKLLISMKEEHVLILSTHIMELALDICDDVVILHDGVLREVQRDSLEDEAYKNKIIDLLRDGADFSGTNSESAALDISDIPDAAWHEEDPES